MTSCVVQYARARLSPIPSPSWRGIATGDTDDEVLDYLTDRYSDFILLRPRVKPTNYVLWFGPVIVLVGGAGGLWYLLIRRRRRGLENAPVPLSETERKELERLSRNDLG